MVFDPPFMAPRSQTCRIQQLNPFCPIRNVNFLNTITVSHCHRPSRTFYQELCNIVGKDKDCYDNQFTYVYKTLIFRCDYIFLYVTLSTFYYFRWKPYQIPKRGFIWPEKSFIVFKGISKSLELFFVVCHLFRYWRP